MDLRKSASVFICGLVVAAFSACDSGGGSASTPVSNSDSPVSGAPAPQPGTASPPTAGAPARAWTTDAMVFAGDGTWGVEVSSIENILSTNGATYQEVDSPTLDAMTVDQLASFGLLIFPGGEGGTEAGSVSAQTHANLREAVQSRGVSYLGFCAGSFVAVAPAPAAGQDVSYGFGIVNGPILNEWPGTSADYEMQLESFPGGSSVNLLWYGGPITPNSGVIAKYPTGDPAISEMWSGNGFVVLSGVHPTATQAILDSLGVTPDTPDTTLAWQLMYAALHQAPLPTF